MLGVVRAFLGFASASPSLCMAQAPQGLPLLHFLADLSPTAVLLLRGECVLVANEAAESLLCVSRQTLEGSLTPRDPSPRLAYITPAASCDQNKEERSSVTSALLDLLTTDQRDAFLEACTRSEQKQDSSSGLLLHLSLPTGEKLTVAARFQSFGDQTCCTLLREVDCSSPSEKPWYKVRAL